MTPLSDLERRQILQRVRLKQLAKHAVAKRAELKRLAGSAKDCDDASHR